MHSDACYIIQLFDACYIVQLLNIFILQARDAGEVVFQNVHIPLTQPPTYYRMEQSYYLLHISCSVSFEAWVETETTDSYVIVLTPYLGKLFI